ncbi:MAG TPA: hypothetical protein VFG42_14280 [Baekduia sp.]|uniref:hypothetical protein n=1 Tax=Baekduia sp. TaxID=2600305 RepID=UPI002D7981BC|nr:hypothetical protein [Baekduia sp.]HET6507954.1 hypothetical protein [Baekduia sp.]
MTPFHRDADAQRRLVTLLAARNDLAASPAEVAVYTAMLPAVMTDVDALYAIPGARHVEPAVIFRPHGVEGR